MIEQELKPPTEKVIRQMVFNGESQAKKKRGRRSTYTPAIAARICDRITQGESLVTICKRKGAPSQRAVYRWLEDNAAFRQRYARARET